MPWPPFPLVESCWSSAELTTTADSSSSSKLHPTLTVMAAQPFLHENIHIDDKHGQHHHRGSAPAPLLPTSAIPDLRFEYSYLRSIQPYVQVERVSTGGNKDKSADTLVNQAMIREGVFETLGSSLHMTEKDFAEEQDTLKKLSGPRKSDGRPSEIIHVQWKNIAWVTLRDQVISPLLQGALWAIVGYHVKPLFARAGSRVGTFVYGYLPTKEGLGISWLRRWAQNIGLTRSSHNHKTLRPSQ